MRLAGPVDLQTLDPAKAKDLGTLFLVRQLFSGLTRLDDDLQPVPALAETIDVSDDGLTYTFTLRRDARFADGRDITADDVAFSLNRALDPATTDGDASQLAAPTFLSDIVGARELLDGRGRVALGRSRDRRPDAGDRSGRTAIDVSDAPGDRPSVGGRS